MCKYDVHLHTAPCHNTLFRLIKKCRVRETSGSNCASIKIRQRHVRNTPCKQLALCAFCRTAAEIKERAAAARAALLQPDFEYAGGHSSNSAQLEVEKGAHAKEGTQGQSTITSSDARVTRSFVELDFTPRGATAQWNSVGSSSVPVVRNNSKIAYTVREMAENQNSGLVRSDSSFSLKNGMNQSQAKPFQAGMPGIPTGPRALREANYVRSRQNSQALGHKTVGVASTFRQTYGPMQTGSTAGNYNGGNQGPYYQSARASDNGIQPGSLNDAMANVGLNAATATRTGNFPQNIQVPTGHNVYAERYGHGRSMHGARDVKSHGVFDLFDEDSSDRESVVTVKQVPRVALGGGAANAFLKRGRPRSNTIHHPFPLSEREEIIRRRREVGVAQVPSDSRAPNPFHRRSSSCPALGRLHCEAELKNGHGEDRRIECTRDEFPSAASVNPNSSFHDLVSPITPACDCHVACAIPGHRTILDSSVPESFYSNSSSLSSSSSSYESSSDDEAPGHHDGPSFYPDVFGHFTEPAGRTVGWWRFKGMGEKDRWQASVVQEWRWHMSGGCMIDFIAYVWMTEYKVSTYVPEPLSRAEKQKRIAQWVKLPDRDLDESSSVVDVWVHTVKKCVREGRSLPAPWNLDECDES